MLKMRSGVDRNWLAAIVIGLAVAACGGGGGGGDGSSVSLSNPITPATPVAPPPVPAALNVKASADIPEGAKGVPIDRSWILSFSTPMNAAGLRPDLVVLTDGKSTFPVNTEVSQENVKFTPVARLRNRTNYQLILKRGITAADGSILQNDFTLNFKTVIATFENAQIAQVDGSVAGGDFPKTAIADLNGDGRIDIVEVAALYRPDLFAANGYRLNFFMQEADGKFTKRQTLEVITSQNAANQRYASLILADIDGDGRPEVIMPEYRAEDPEGSGIRIFKADSKGQYAQYQFIKTLYTSTLQAVDVDGDARMDLVGADYARADRASAGFQVLHNNGKGFDQLPPVLMPLGYYELGFADLDHDGKLDIIANQLGDGTKAVGALRIYSQNDQGVFAPNAVLSSRMGAFCKGGFYCRNMMVADMNGDGQPDLVFTVTTAVFGDTQPPAVEIYNLPKAGDLERVTHTALAYDDAVVAVKDMDGDGIADVVTLNSAGYFAVVGGKPDFGLEFSVRYFTPEYMTFQLYNITVGDLDGDGNPDILFDSSFSGVVVRRQVR